MITSETVVGESTVSGRAIEVQRTPWRGQDGASCDLLDAVTGETMTEESSGRYPTQAQMEAARPARRRR